MIMGFVKNHKIVCGIAAAVLIFTGAGIVGAALALIGALVVEKGAEKLNDKVQENGGWMKVSGDLASGLGDKIKGVFKGKEKTESQIVAEGGEIQPRTVNFGDKGKEQKKPKDLEKEQEKEQPKFKDDSVIGGKDEPKIDISIEGKEKMKAGLKEFSASLSKKDFAGSKEQSEVAQLKVDQGKQNQK